jgi:hypothetical protein
MPYPYSGNLLAKARHMVRKRGKIIFPLRRYISVFDWHDAPLIEVRAIFR